jgi:hypothetical protein
MTARIAVKGELRVHGREVEIIVSPGWSDADLHAAAALAGAPVRFTVEPVTDPEPLTGGDADINVRVRIKDCCPDPWQAGRVGTLLEYDASGGALVRLDAGISIHQLPRVYIERAPVDCPHCGAVRVTR